LQAAYWLGWALRASWIHLSDLHGRAWVPPAPAIPTRHLVVTGLYRYVRNPMYVAVVSAILGQGLILGNVSVLEYGALVWLLFHLFVLVYEEPTLRASFGPEYEAFCAAVPRWIPRLSPRQNIGVAAAGSTKRKD